jgi:transposase InsO family protein
MLIKAAPSVRFELIRSTAAHDNNLLHIGTLCEIAGVSRSGYYYWLEAEKKRAKGDWQDERDFALIKKAYRAFGYAKGRQGIHMRLLREDPPVVMNTKKISRLMRKFGLKCPVRRINPYRKMRKATQESKIAPNILNRKFRTGGARRVLLTDITYIPRYSRSKAEQKYTYLAVVMDAFTKEILAFVLSMFCDTDIVVKMIRLLIDNHGGELKTDALLHDDQGCQYTSSRFTQLLVDEGLRQSMSRQGNCWDNAPQESFFGHMKDAVRILPSDDHLDVVRKVTEWIAYYNTQRPQWNLDKLTPTEYYGYVTTGVYPLPFKPQSVVKREKMVESKTVEELIIEEETEKRRKKAEKAKQKKLVENGIYPLSEQAKTTAEPLGGSAPKPLEFIALVSGEGKKEDDTS